MNCEEIKSRLFLYWDKELSEQESRIFEHHLSQCATCQKEFETIVSINSIGKAKIFPEPEAGYWQELTGNIMEKIRPALKRKTAAQKIFDTLISIAWPQKLNYRIAGLAVAMMMVLFFVKISFFDRGKFDVPIELEKQLTTSDDISEKKIFTELPGQQKQEEAAPFASERGPLTLPVEQNNKSAAPEKGPATIAASKTEAATVVSSAKDEEKVLEGEASQSDKIASSRRKTGEGAYGGEQAKQKSDELEECKFAESSREKMAAPHQGSSVRPASNTIAVADSKALAASQLNFRKSKAELQTVAFQADGIVVPEDSLLAIQKQLTLLTHVENKILFLKTFLVKYPDSSNKNQVIFLLAENLAGRAEETQSEKFVAEAIEFFDLYQVELKTSKAFNQLAARMEEIKKLLGKN